MKIKIQRYDKTATPQSFLVEYDIPEGLTLLQSLQYTKATIDPTLSFRAGCRSGICGTCSMRVDGKEKLACSHIPQGGELIEPLLYHEVKRDLIVDKSSVQQKLQQSTAWLHQTQETSISITDEKKTELQSDCILCSSCYSACPVFAVNSDFLGPYALTRVYRYTADPREADIKSAIDEIQLNGVWDCTLCGECTAVCPQSIDPKMDITMLRGTSSQYGHMDPNFATMNFGFNPNGGF